MVIRWSMVSMETIVDVYHDRTLPELFEIGVDNVPVTGRTAGFRTLSCDMQNRRRTMDG